MDVYRLVLNVYKTELSEIVACYSNQSICTDNFIEISRKWQFHSTHIDLSGTFRGQRLKITTVTIKTLYGLDILKSIAKISKGTVIGIIDLDMSKLPIFVNKGQDLNVSLEELETGIRKVKTNGDT